MSFLYALSESLSRLIMRIGKLAAWLAIPLMLVIIFDVVTRELKSNDAFRDVLWLQNFFTSIEPYASSTKLQELEWHLHGALFLLCFGFAYLKDAHVRIELVRDGLGTRPRVWIELIGIVLFLMPYAAIIIIFGYDFAVKSFESGEVSAALTGLPHRWIIKAVLPIGFVVVALAGLSVLLRCIVYLAGPPNLRRSAARYFVPHELSKVDEQGRVQ